MVVQVRTGPLFVLYLVLLMHNFFLGLVASRPGARGQQGPPHGPHWAQSWRVICSRDLLMLRWLTWKCVAGALASAVYIGRWWQRLLSECLLAPHCLLLHVQVRHVLLAPA